MQLKANIKKYLCMKEVWAVVIAILIFFPIYIGISSLLSKDVTINYNGRQIKTTTLKSNVKQVLRQNGITLTQYDYVSLPEDSLLSKFSAKQIDVKTAVPIYAFADGREVKIMTYRDNVKDAVENGGLGLTALDRIVGAALTDAVAKDMKFRIVRVKESTISKKEAVPFKVVSKENNHMDRGVQRIAREGKEGTRQKVFKVVMEDGLEVKRFLSADTVVQQPIDKVVECGTLATLKTSRGDVVRFNKTISMSATAYTASYEDTGKSPGQHGFGITASGARARRGIIAVDPRVIPLGTRVYVQGVGRTPDYGYAIAGDTGGAIKGNIIDLYFDSSNEVRSWGRRKVNVLIVQD